MLILSKGGGLLAVLYWVLLSHPGTQAAEGTWSRRADIGAAQGDWIPLAGALPHGQPQPFHQARLLQPQIPPQLLNQQFHQSIVGGWNEEHEARQQAHYVGEEVNKGRVPNEYSDGVRTDQEQYQQRPSPQQKEQVQILYVPVETLRQRSRGLISQKELVKQSNLKEEEVYLDAPQSRHQIPPAERHPTIPTGQREVEATKNTPQRLAQQIPTPNIPEVPQTLPQQQFSTPHIIPQQNVAPQILPQQNLAPQIIPQQNLAPQIIPQQNVAPQIIPQQNVAPQIIPQQNVAPQNVAEHIPVGLPARPPSPSHVLLQVPQYFQQPAVHQTPIATLIQQIPQHQQAISKPKEKEPFRHPIQPLKDQKPGNIKVTKLNPDYYDSIKETSQSVVARDQLFHQYQDEDINQPKLNYEELTTIRQESPRNKQLLRHQTEETPVTRKEEITQVTKEEPTEDNARNWYDNNYARNSQEQLRQRYEQLTASVGGVEHVAPQQSAPKYEEGRPPQTYQFYPEQQTTTVFSNEENKPRNEGLEKNRQNIQSNSESVNLPPPNQPPLSVYMETGPNTKVGDVLSLLNGAKTIPVLDTIGPNSPQVFVGPSNLKAPQGYVKFELPYLSSLDGNRVERKVLQLPFFVAPLNFNPPAGYAKIPFPPPHIGSVVLSNVSANLEEKEPPQVKLVPTTNVASTNREPYAIPADISSISPHLPSLINSLQEEQGATTKPEVVPETELPRKPATRRPVYRGSQRGYATTSSTSSPRRNYGHRRRPYNRNSSRQQTTEATTLNTIDQQQISQNQQINNFSELDQQEIQQNTYKNQNYKNIYDNSNNVRRPTAQLEEEDKGVSDLAQYHITAEQVPSSEPNKNTAIYQYDYVTTTEQLQTRNYQTKQTVPTGAATPPGFEEPTPVHSQELRKPYERPTLHIPPHLQQEIPQLSPDTDRPIRPLYQTENLQPTTERIQKEIYNQQFTAYNENVNADVKQKYHLVEPTVENENRQRVSAQYPTQTSTAPRTVQLPDSAQFPPIYDLKNHKDQSDFYNVQEVPSNPTVQYPDYQTVTEDMKLTQVSEDNNSRLQNHRLQNEKVQNEDVVEYKTESVLRETTRPPNKGKNRLRSRLYTSRLRTTTVPTSDDKLYDYTKRYSRDEITEPPRRTNNLRARRPSRPLITTTIAAPETTTTTLPPGTKYLIRTRRPTNNGQIKLKTGRSRIRRPTTPTTTTTTSTTTANPFANYNVQLNQQQQYYDTLQDTTPFPNRYIIPNPAPSSSQAGYDSQGPLPTVSTEDYYKQGDHKTSTKLPKVINYYDLQNRQKDKNLNNNYWTQSFKQDDYERAVVSTRPEEDLYEQAKRQKDNALKDEYWINPASVKQADYLTTTPKQELYYEQQTLRQKEKLNENRYWEENLKKEYEIPSRSRSSATEHPSRRHKVKTAQREWAAASDRPQPNSQYYENQRRQKVTVPKLTTEAPLPRVKYTESPLNSKDAQDFWNQAVTIQQSKSYEYNPDEQIGAVRKTTAATPHDDYYYDDQSPFPSNEQQVTYVGMKAGVERGKDNQYAVDVQDEVLASPTASSEAPQVDNKSPDMEHIHSTNLSNNGTVERKAGRRRGTWVKVRVKKTKDVFETAESQRFGSLITNSLHEPIKEVSKILKTGKTKIETDSIESNTSVDNIINESTTEQLPTTTSIEPIKDLEFESTTMGEEAVETSTTGLAALLDETTTTILPETPLPKVLATSTTTEVTLETEICYRGRCVKTKGSRPTVQQDLIPGE